MTEKTINLHTYYYNKTEIDNLLKSKNINASEANPVDLNEYITGGFYYCNNNTRAAYISPLPAAGKSFWLLVEDWGTSNYTKQTLTHYHNNKTFIRVRTNNGGWGEWEELSKATHTHGNITSDGEIGSTANKPLITTTDGKIITGSFGTTANTFCQGNDNRLSNARAPTSHSHGNITNDGKIGSTEGQPIITTTNGTLSAGSFESTTSNIKMNGTANVGSLNTFARADHVHPSDTSKSKVSFTRNLTSGTKLGTITIDGVAVDLYSTNDTTYSAVTQSNNGLMTSGDKQKVDKSMMIGFATAGGTTSAFTASITGATLTHGTIIAVYNAIGNNAANATLNVNNLGAKPIYYNASAITASRYPNKTTCLFMYNTTIVSNGCWQMIYSSDTNTTYTAASTTPIMDGKGTVGTSVKYAREDHVHPTDTSRASTSTATTSINGLMSSADKTKLDGIATGANKTILNNTVTSTSTSEAATANAVKTAYDKGNHSHPYIRTTAESVGTTNLANKSVTYSKLGSDIEINGVNLLQGTKNFSSPAPAESDFIYDENYMPMRYNNCRIRSAVTDGSDINFNWTISNKYLDSGGYYVLSFWACTWDDSHSQLFTYFYSGDINTKRITSNSTYGTNMNTSNFGDGATQFTIDETWKRYYVVYQLNSTSIGTANKTLTIRLKHDANMTPDINLAGVKFERGNIPTGWSPNPREPSLWENRTDSLTNVPSSLKGTTYFVVNEETRTVLFRFSGYFASGAANAIYYYPSQDPNASNYTPKPMIPATYRPKIAVSGALNFPGSLRVDTNGVVSIQPGISWNYSDSQVKPVWGSCMWYY